VSALFVCGRGTCTAFMHMLYPGSAITMTITGLVHNHVPRCRYPFRVRRVSFNGCPGMDDTLLKAFAKKCKKIRELDVRGCAVTSSAVNALAKSCLYVP
jgi:hypothetical protein